MCYSWLEKGILSHHLRTADISRRPLPSGNRSILPEAKAINQDRAQIPKEKNRYRTEDTEEMKKGHLVEVTVISDRAEDLVGK
jgi:hypothetical protein